LIRLTLPEPGEKPLQVLCLGAHSDDIEIGCGGTLLRLKQTDPGLKLHWVVLSSAGIRGREAAKSAALFTEGCDSEIELKEFRDGFFPYDGANVKLYFEELKNRIQPDLIFTHWSGDAHQDHRITSELTWNTFRNHLILEYEIPKYDGDLGRPNLFVPLDTNLCNEKIEHLFKSFESQSPKQWFSPETFMGLMRIRGMESNSASGYAEGFYAKKVSL
jgi:LmbE family N-acetylglucosaminyl deacetylase